MIGSALAKDPLSASLINAPASLGSAALAAAPPTYFMRSPMAASRITTTMANAMAPTTFITPPGTAASLAGLAAPLGPSFVAAPRLAMPASAAAPPGPTIMLTSGGTVPGATLTYGAPAMPLRPSFVAAQPVSATTIASTPPLLASAAVPAASAAMPAEPMAAVMQYPYVTSQMQPVAAAPPVITYAPSTASNYITAGTIAGGPTFTTVTRAPTATTTATIAPRPSVTPAAAPGVSAEYVASLEKRLADLEVVHACKTHSAFVFIKPHAITEDVQRLVREHLEAFGIEVLSEGMIASEDIDRLQLIDTHYGAIASKAVKQTPAELTVQPRAQEEFQSVFGLSWDEALEQGVVFNALQGAEALGITTDELAQRWGALTKGVDLLKFGGGFYCGKIEEAFIINGFYLDMRGKFTAPGTCIHYYETEWNPRKVSWQDFRGKVLGATDPATAEPGSLRNLIYSSWESLGLSAIPDTGDNGVHASASPFEALAERANWLGLPVENDYFGRALLASGIPLSTIQEWCSDPAVNFEGSKQSLFDLLEDLNSRECLQKAAMIAAENTEATENP